MNGTIFKIDDQYALAQFPKTCSCGHCFETPEQFVRETVPPRKGEVGSGMWFRSHLCAGVRGGEYTICIELTQEDA